MFLGVAWPFELIKCLLAVPKCDLGEVEKELFNGSNSLENSFSTFW
jgi:hypothetical protein